MASNRISRNDPCPCGSGKKFKHCCIGKGIDWEARRAAATRRLPRPAPSRQAAPQPGFFPGAFGVVDAKLKEVAKAAPAGAAWKPPVEALTAATLVEERIKAYQAIREAAVLPPDAAFFLFGHAAQWVLPATAPDTPEEEDEGGDDDFLDRHTVAVLRRFGLDDLADHYAHDRLEYERRHERGRQFFFGPPDERLAEGLREKGIIE
jgi:hypothetical protein